MNKQEGMKRREFLMGMVGSAAAAQFVHAAVPEATSKKLRYGVVGTGHRSQGGHLPILKGYFPNVEIVALSDITRANLQEGLRICGPATKGYLYHQEMLEKHPELDAVIVIVPDFKHAEVTIDALEAGKHVLCEKPITTHLADADRMIGTAERKKLVLQIGHQMRYMPVFEQAAKVIREGRIGTVEYVFGSLFRGDWNPQSWKYTDPVTGVSTNWRFLTYCEGSALLEDGIHELDVIHWLVGDEPVRVQATGGNNIFRNRETIDHAGLLIDFAGGAKCTFAFSLFTPGGSRTMELYGSTGRLRIENSKIFLTPYRGHSEEVPVPASAPPASRATGRGRHVDIATYNQHQAFIHSMMTGAPPFADGKVGRAAAHISLAAEHSLRNGGKPVAWSNEEGL